MKRVKKGHKRQQKSIKGKYKGKKRRNKGEKMATKGTRAKKGSKVVIGRAQRVKGTHVINSVKDYSQNYRESQILFLMTKNTI